jgi:hypothetical protein
MVEDDENETIARESDGCMHGDWIAETSIAGVSGATCMVLHFADCLRFEQRQGKVILKQRWAYGTTMI